MTDVGVPRRVEPDDPEYRRQADAEAAFWGGVRGPCEAMIHAADDVFTRHTNRRFTGEERTPWYETLARYGTFRRGLSLGVSSIEQDARILATNPRLHLTAVDISGEAVARWQRELGARFPGRVAARQADLNFVELERAAFDLVVSAATLHHVVNLEQLAAQIAGALAPDGWFFLHDYVGESGRRFVPAKRALVELLHARAVARRRPPGRAGLVWRDQEAGRYSPFCTVRSADILAALRAELHEVSVHAAGTIVGLLQFCEPAAPAPARRSWLGDVPAVVRRAFGSVPLPPGADAASIRELFLLDDVVCDAGVLLPHNVFAVYRPRGRQEAAR